MPQLIAMIIIVVGAMIYMFQTFGGTGDKIEGIAQKASIITEINNIKDGVKIAAKSSQIGSKDDATKDIVTTLNQLASLSYFAQQINEQILENAKSPTSIENTYSAISFGGKVAADEAKMLLQLAVGTKKGLVPGIFVDLSGFGVENGAFLEAQVANDLKAIAHISRKAEKIADVGTVAMDATADAIGVDTRIPADVGGGTEKDGKFIIYFKDFGVDEVSMNDK